MSSRAMDRRAFFNHKLPVSGHIDLPIGKLTKHTNCFVFVAADGGFFCRDCVSSPCNKMVEATLADLSEVFNEGRQWCIIGAQEPVLGHGDTCDHCGAFTLPKPTDADAPVVEPLREARKRQCLRDLDVFQGGTAPWWLIENVNRYFGGDCDGGHDA